MKILCPQCNNVVDTDSKTTHIEGEPDYRSCACGHIISLQYDELREANALAVRSQTAAININPTEPINVLVESVVPARGRGYCQSCGTKLGLWSRTVKGEDICPKCKDAQRESILREYQQGNLPIVESTTLMLERNEKCYLEYPATLNEEVKVRKGGMGGFSFRIMKGVYYHTGRFKSEPTPEMREVDKGNLYITSERVVFVGDKQSFGVPFKKVLGVKGYIDGFQIDWEGKKKPIVFSVDDVGLVLSILAGAISNYRMS